MFLFFLPLLFVRQGCQSSIDNLFAFEDHLAIDFHFQQQLSQCFDNAVEVLMISQQLPSLKLT